MEGGIRDHLGNLPVQIGDQPVQFLLRQVLFGHLQVDPVALHPLDATLHCNLGWLITPLPDLPPLPTNFVHRVRQSHVGVVELLRVLLQQQHLPFLFRPRPLPPLFLRFGVSGHRVDHLLLRLRLLFLLLLR